METEKVCAGEKKDCSLFAPLITLLLLLQTQWFGWVEAVKTFLSPDLINDALRTFPQKNPFSRCDRLWGRRAQPIVSLPPPENIFPPPPSRWKMSMHQLQKCVAPEVFPPPLHEGKSEDRR